MNLTMNSTIIELSVHACNFVLKVLHREEPGARVWPKLMLKLQPKIAICSVCSPAFLHNFHTYTTVYFSHPIIKRDKNLVVGDIFVDFRKAFDSISHHVLLNKFQAVGVAGELWC